MKHFLEFITVRDVKIDADGFEYYGDFFDSFSFGREASSYDDFLKMLDVELDSRGYNNDHFVIIINA